MSALPAGQRVIPKFERHLGQKGSGTAGSGTATPVVDIAVEGIEKPLKAIAIS
jgi:hypothetical protein